MVRRFRVIQGGKKNDGTGPLSAKRLYRAYSIGNLTRSGEIYYDVKFNWYCMERAEPIAPYEALILEHEKLEPSLLQALQKEVDRYFTDEEIPRLAAYLEARYGLELKTEEVALPIRTRGELFAEGNEVIYDFLELSDKENYSLPFKVWGYYTIAGCLSTPELESGVAFLRESLQLLGLAPVWSDKDLERVARTLYEREGLVVKNQKEG